MNRSDFQQLAELRLRESDRCSPQDFQRVHTIWQGIQSSARSRRVHDTRMGFATSRVFSYCSYGLYCRKMRYERSIASCCAPLLSADLAEPKPMRRGSLSERMSSAASPGALAPTTRCSSWPYFSLTRGYKADHSRFLTPAQARSPAADRAGQEFRAKLDTLWEGCEAWADSQLQGSSAASIAGPKKGLQANLQEEIVQEIETLLGSQSVANLDFERWKWRRGGSSATGGVSWNNA